MGAQKYQNEDGVIVTAEQITDEHAEEIAGKDGEYVGFWLTLDATNVQGRVPDELFKPVSDEKPKSKQKQG